MSANVGTLDRGAARQPSWGKALLVGVLVAAALTAGAFLLTRPSAPAPPVSQPVTAYILPQVPETGSQFASTSSGHPEYARRKFGGVPASQGQAKGPFVRHKWGW